MMMKQTLKRIIADECDNKNHKGLAAVLCGERLPSPDLGEDAAFVAANFTIIEGQLRDTQERLFKYMQECDRLRAKLDNKEKK